MKKLFPFSRKMPLWIAQIMMALALAPLSSLQAHADQGSARAVATEVMMAFGKSQAQVLSNVLYYPAHYAQAELQANQQAMQLLFGFFFQKAGEVSAIKPCTKEPELSRFWFDGGDKADWVKAEKPKATTEVCYQAHFSHLGDGYVIVSLLELVNNGQAQWFPYRVTYGVPKDNPKDKAKIDQLSKDAAAFIRAKLGGK
ncbi:hypothetical protein [Mangrovitalea sediminis]|uniref:hypothetical protein n=1 Tax=Mangrovitalea sediminis TaxID=1982043 RepID=UPI000BE5F516|nr:hypothetical protein [Mangrovitalea sediminis]